MSEPFGKPRRPLVPKLEPLFLAAQNVSDSVEQMKVSIESASAYCRVLEDALENIEPTFDAVRDVNAAVSRLRQEITSAAEFAIRMDSLASELRNNVVTDDSFQKPRLLTHT